MVKVKSDKPEQSTLITAVKNVKQKLLTKQLKKPEIKISTDTVPDAKTEAVPLTRGIVYLGHIPHGFFESQMHDYFKQFGRVTRVRLVRSQKTGRSRGYGYVEFQHCEVAKIAAESMNNYLMSGRLLKATYIPPEKQHGGFFSGRQWSKQNYPGMVKRAQQNSLKNKNVDSKRENTLLKRGLSRLSNIEKKLEAAGVIYKIKPVEVPAPVVEKRKAAVEAPSGEAKKRKIASTESKPEELEKEIAVAESAGKKVKAKDVSKKVVAKQNKKKTEPKVAPVEKKEEVPKSATSVVPKSKKKVKAEVATVKAVKPAVQKIEKQLLKKSKKALAGVKISEELMEKVANGVLTAKKSKKATAAVVAPVAKPKQKKEAVVAVAEKPKKKKNTSAASPSIEKSMQKKNTVTVPSVKKSKQKLAPPVSQNKKGKKAKKSVAA